MADRWRFKFCLVIAGGEGGALTHGREWGVDVGQTHTAGNAMDEFTCETNASSVYSIGIFDFA